MYKFIKNFDKFLIRLRHKLMNKLRETNWQYYFLIFFLMRIKAKKIGGKYGKNKVFTRNATLRLDPI